MNWEAIGAIGEIVGAIGVIVTVGYLAVQVRQNTKALHTSSYQHDADQMNRLNVSIVENPQFATVLTKAYTDYKSLSDPEWLQLNAYLISMFHVFETLFHGFNSGSVPGELWHAEENGLRSIINQPAVEIWWCQILKTGPYTQDFREHVDSLRGETVEDWVNMIKVPSPPKDS